MGIAIGLGSILFVTVVIGTKLTEQVEFPQDGNGTDYLQQGLVVFYTVPTTISSGVVLTEQAEGNVALALLLTVVSNIVGVFTIPVMLQWLVGLAESADGEDVQLDIGALIVKLTLIVLVSSPAGAACVWVPLNAAARADTAAAWQSLPRDHHRRDRVCQAAQMGAKGDQHLRAGGDAVDDVLQGDGRREL